VESASEATPEDGRDFPLRLALILNCAAIAVVMVAWILRVPGFLYDDAYITITYADNLMRGDGFVFNVGERVLGTTAPGLAMLIALFGFPFGNALWGAAIVGHLSFLVLGIGCCLLFESTRPGMGFCGVIAFTLAALNPELRDAFGMETHLTMGLYLCILYLHVKDRLPALMGLMMALALLLRPDTVFFGLMVGLSCIAMGRIPWRALAGFAVVIGAWVLFALVYFGNAVPHSVYAKSVLGEFAQSSAMFPPALERTLQAQGWLEWQRLWIAMGGLLFAMVRQLRGFSILVGHLLLYVTAFTLTGVESFSWYHIPILIGLYLGLAVWIESLFALARNHWAMTAGSVLALGGSLALLVMVIVAGPKDPRKVTEPVLDYEISYREIALHLNENAGPDEMLVTAEIGILGYYADFPIVDLRGLVRPAVLEHIARGEYTWWNHLDPLPKHVLTHRPPWKIEGAPAEFLLREYVMEKRTGQHDLYVRSENGMVAYPVDELTQLRDLAAIEEDEAQLQRIAQELARRRSSTELITTLLALYQLQVPTEDQLRLLTDDIFRSDNAENIDLWLESLPPIFARQPDLQSARRAVEFAHVRGRHAIVRDICDAILAEHPETPQFTHDLGRALIHLHEFDRAVSELELIQDDPVMGVWAHRLLAIAATEQGDWEEALKQWQHCAAYGPPTLRSDALEQIERIRARQR
jgi:hypothetical protein